MAAILSANVNVVAAPGFITQQRTRYPNQPAGTGYTRRAFSHQYPNRLARRLRACYFRASRSFRAALIRTRDHDRIRLPVRFTDAEDTVMRPLKLALGSLPHGGTYERCVEATYDTLETFSTSVFSARNRRPCVL